MSNLRSGKVRAVSLWLLVWGAGVNLACVEWSAAGPSPEVVLRQNRSMVRVTLDDGSRLVLRQPVIRSDSMVERELSTAVPLAAVKGIEVRRTNGLRTAGAVIGGALILCVAICPRPEIPPICLDPEGCDDGGDQP